MATNEAVQEERRHHQDPVSLRHERRRIRKMKVIFGLFSAVLLLSLLLSMLLNQ